MTLCRLLTLVLGTLIVWFAVWVYLESNDPPPECDWETQVVKTYRECMARQGYVDAHMLSQNRYMCCSRLPTDIPHRSQKKPRHR
jgi:hypothetical protein